MNRDRLADIWARFGQGTQARLSGATIENTMRPSADNTPRYRAPGQALADAVHAPSHAGTPDPVAEAKEALRAGMAAKRAKRSAAPEPSGPEDLIASQLLADLKATERRVARRQTDYLAYAASMQGQRRKRRKIFGLF